MHLTGGQYYFARMRTSASHTSTQRRLGFCFLFFNQDTLERHFLLRHRPSTYDGPDNYCPHTNVHCYYGSYIWLSLSRYRLSLQTKNLKCCVHAHKNISQSKSEESKVLLSTCAQTQPSFPPLCVCNTKQAHLVFCCRSPHQSRSGGQFPAAIGSDGSFLTA